MAHTICCGIEAEAIWFTSRMLILDVCDILTTSRWGLLIALSLSDGAEITLAKIHLRVPHRFFDARFPWPFFGGAFPRRLSLSSFIFFLQAKTSFNEAAIASSCDQIEGAQALPCMGITFPDPCPQTWDRALRWVLDSSWPPSPQ